MSETSLRLRTLREARGLTLAEAARRAGVDAGLLSRVERGRQRPSLRLLRRLAPVIGARDLERALEVIGRYEVAG